MIYQTGATLNKGNVYLNIISSLTLKWKFIFLVPTEHCKVFSHILSPSFYCSNSEVDYHKFMDHGLQSFWAYSPCGYDFITTTSRVKDSEPVFLSAAFL